MIEVQVNEMIVKITDKELNQCSTELELELPKNENFIATVINQNKIRTLMATVPISKHFIRVIYIYLYIFF